MENIKSLLNQVTILRKKNEEILDATGGRFNMFRACGVDHYETKHSKIIAEFLDPKGTHGLKSKLLELFIETLHGEIEVGDSERKKFFEVFDYVNATVKIEDAFDEGRMDILITTNNPKRAIIIENKIYSVDKGEQLKRYDKHAKQIFGGKENYQILYLTLSGEDASDQSADSVEYLPISHERTIIGWLEKCVPISARFPILRETIIQYINHLKSLTNQDMDAKNKNELVKMILNNRDYLESANEISNIWPYCTKEIIKRLIPKMETIATNLNLKFYVNEADIVKQQGGFWFKKAQWDYIILFWFQGGIMGVGIDESIPQGIKCQEEKKNMLKEFLKDYQIHKTKDWNWIWGTTFDAWNNCAWEDKEEKMPIAIEEIIKKIMDKLTELGE